MIFCPEFVVSSPRLLFRHLFRHRPPGRQHDAKLSARMALVHSSLRAACLVGRASAHCRHANANEVAPAAIHRTRRSRDPARVAARVGCVCVFCTFCSVMLEFQTRFCSELCSKLMMVRQLISTLSRSSSRLQNHISNIPISQIGSRPPNYFSVARRPALCLSPNTAAMRTNAIQFCLPPNLTSIGIKYSCKCENI
jgi:hypothetical protein